MNFVQLEKETLAYSSAASKVSNNPTSSTGVTGSFGANNSANKSAVGSKSTVAKVSNWNFNTPCVESYFFVAC